MSQNEADDDVVAKEPDLGASIGADVDGDELECAVMKSAATRPLPPGVLKAAFKRYDTIQHERVTALFNLHRAVFAESLVAELLPGSELSPDPAHNYDIKWTQSTDDIRIEVKCSGGYLPRYGEGRESSAKWKFPIQKQIWDPEARRRVRNAKYQFDVLVLARHVGSQLGAGWSFHVLNAENALDVGGRARASISKTFPSVDGPALAAAVRSAFDRR